jgi:putative endonuclease
MDLSYRQTVIPSEARNLALSSSGPCRVRIRAGEAPAVKNYYVYIMASASRVLYTGVTSNLERRVLQHRRKLLGEFTARYNINRLVYYEVSSEIVAAIAREKQIKGWSRKKKIAVIESVNRDWKDLSAGWYGARGGVTEA